MPTFVDVARDVAGVLALEVRAALESSGLAALIAERGRSLSRAIIAAALDLERRDGALVVRARLEQRTREPASSVTPAVVLELEVEAPTSARVPRRPPRARNGATKPAYGLGGVTRRQKFGFEQRARKLGKSRASPSAWPISWMATDGRSILPTASPVASVKRRERFTK
jgi:hypothetical protein